MDSKTSAKRFLALYFLIFFGAIFLRVDYFPLSWVPMYGYHVTRPVVTVSVGDKDQRKRGFAAQRANGEKLYISGEDLGVPSANFRRLYHQRAFNHGPPQDDRERAALMSFNRWWYETFVGPDPRLDRRYADQLLISVNRTFGYGPQDPQRIVRLEATLDFATFTRADVAVGNLSRPTVERRTAIVTEQGAFLRTGDKVVPMPRGLERDAGE
ncbi:MAG TPA: hypothetical protein VGD23_09805 [Sphingomicrobium sp.]